MGGKEKMFNVWFNTYFLKDNKLYAPKPTIDKANKDKKHKIYPEDFAVEFIFDSAPGESELYDEQAAVVTAAVSDGATGADAPQGSAASPPDDGPDDADLTTDDEDDDEDEWEGLPITDV